MPHTRIISEKEANLMVSQNATPSMQNFGGTLPYVFTEYGVLQLSNILRSEKATLMSIKIIEVFIKMREMLLSHKDIMLELELIKKKVNGQDERIDLIYNYLMEFVNQKKINREKVGYK